MTKDRYNRQVRLPGFGKEAQEKLGKSKVLVVGLGGLGVPVVQYLNAMGVGTLGLLDHDTVSLSNLHRQVLYRESDVGRKKVSAARDILHCQNSATELIAIDTYLNRSNGNNIIKEYDVIVDASDNFETRYAINDLCVKLNKPMVYGALHGYEGQLTVFNYQGGPTYRCLYPEPPEAGEIPNCDVHGVLGVLPGIIGTLQALEAVKICTALGEITSGKMVLFNGLTMNFYGFKFQRRPGAVELAERDSGQNKHSISASELLHMLEREKLQLVDVRTHEEFDDYHLPQAVNIELQNLGDDLTTLEVGNPVYLLCESGIRSSKAQDLIQRTFPQAKVVNVLGGMAQIRSLCL